MREEFLKAGVEETVLEDRRTNKTFRDQVLYQLAGLIERFDSIGARIQPQRKQITFDEYLAGVKGRVLPLCRVSFGGKQQFLYTDEELDDCIERLAHEKKGNLVIYDGPGSGSPLTADLRIDRFEHDRDDLNAILDQVEKLGLSRRECWCPRATARDSNKAPLAVSFDGKVKIPLFSLREIRQELSRVSEDRVEVTRYKGLGEMNDDQLWDSTMDPKQRMLYKVTLDDAFEAERTFAMLMGEHVEPRRLFIEEHAHEATNLDI